jgi:hypothetical protein
MLKAYLDESGKSRDPQHLALCAGSYVLSVEEWDGFRMEWQAVLRRHDAEYFHCREAMHLREGSSKDLGWTRDKVDGLYRELIETLSSCKPKGVVAVVDLKQYRRLFPATRGDKKWDDPYFLSLQTALATIETLPPWEAEIAVVIDQNKQVEDETHRMLSELGQPLERIRRGGLSFGDMRTDCGIQVADILVWEANKHATEHLREARRPTRKSFEHLLEHIATYVKVYSEDELNRLKALNLHDGTPHPSLYL